MWSLEEFGVNKRGRANTNLGLTDAESIEIELFNQGQDTIFEFTLTVKVDTEIEVEQKYNRVMLPGTKLLVPINRPMDFSKAGTYIIDASLLVEENERIYTDHFSGVEVVQVPNISPSLPYLADFEQGDQHRYEEDFIGLERLVCV